MAETELPTFEEAKKCPKCGRIGEERGSRPAPGLPRGTVIHEIYCVTQLCKWFDTVYYVQTNPDGTVPPPTNHTGSKKHYYMNKEDNEMVARVQAGLLAQREAELDEDRREIRKDR